MTFCVNEFLKCSSSVSFFLPLRLLRVPFYLPQLSGESSSLDREREELEEGQRWLMRVQVEPCPMFQTKTDKKTRPTKHGGGLEPWILPISHVPKETT